jgi:hypothetical protein
MFGVEPLNWVIASVCSVGEFLKIRTQLTVKLSTHFPCPSRERSRIFSFKLAEFSVNVNII